MPTFESLQNQRPSIALIRSLWLETETGKHSHQVPESKELEHYFCSLLGSIQLRLEAIKRQMKGVAASDASEILKQKEQIGKELDLCGKIVHFFLYSEAP